MFLLIIPMTMLAEGTQKLVVWLKDGSKIYIELTDEPRTTFEDGKLIITTNGPTSTFLLSNIQRYTFEGPMTGIGSVSSRDLIFAQDSEGVILRNVPEGTNVKLYDMSGKLLQSQTSDGHSSLHFSLTSFPVGVYLVNVDGKKLKVMKR